MTSHSYTIKRSNRAKHLSISVHTDARVVVTVPKGVSDHFVTDFISEKKSWIDTKVEHFKKTAPDTSLTCPAPPFSKYKEIARRIITERTKYFNSILGYSYNRIAIRNQKTRWGSCSSQRNLNFNYRLIFLPELLRDYVIVHELCHLKEMNHSRRFWKLVEAVIPDYRVYEKQLKQYGSLD